MPSFLEFSAGLLNVARALGWPVKQEVKFKIMGATNVDPLPTGATTRLCRVASSSVNSGNGPHFPAPHEAPVIWFNPDTREVKKSTNWKGGTDWELCHSIIEVFSEETTSTVGTINNSGFNNGVAQVPVILQGLPNNPNEAANKDYVDIAIASIASGGIGALYGPPVQSIPDLKALDVSVIPDKHLRLVEDARKIYAYDYESTSAPDDVFIVQPNSGPGRWHATNPQVIDGGTHG